MAGRRSYVLRRACLPNRRQSPQTCPSSKTLNLSDAGQLFVSDDSSRRCRRTRMDTTGDERHQGSAVRPNTPGHCVRPLELPRTFSPPGSRYSPLAPACSDLGCMHRRAKLICGSVTNDGCFLSTGAQGAGAWGGWHPPEETCLNAPDITAPSAACTILSRPAVDAEAHSSPPNA